MNRLLQKTFENRGIDDAFLSDIEDSRHSDLKDMDTMCHCLHDIYVNHKHVVWISDFDMDGIMAGVCGFAGLSELGFYVSLYLPDTSLGYGFDETDIQNILDTYPDVQVIITSDVGIACHSGIAFAVDHGIEVLVTDHHPQQHVDTRATCIVDPLRLDESYEHPYICGAHVVYQILMRYADMYCSQFMQDQISRLAVFAGIATVSDGMTLYHENRDLVRNAVSICHMLYSDSDDDFILRCITGCDVYRRCFMGLQTVFSMFQNYGKLSCASDIDEAFFGYYLAPMFNSLKRMDGNMARGFGVFFGAKPDEDAFYLYDLNEQRKALVAEYVDELYADDQPYAPFVYLSQAPSGILGLLAQKVSDATGVPVLVLHPESDGTLHGSGRSFAWYPFFSRIAENCPISGGGGHDSAFGIQVASITDLESIVHFLNEDVSLYRQSLPSDVLTYKPDFVIATDGSGDVGIDILLFLDYLSELQWYRPFGKGFPSPDILFKFYPSDCVSWQLIGSEKQHLKITLRFGFTVLAWNQGDKIELQSSSEMLCLRGHLSVNTYRDMRTVNFIGDFVDTIVSEKEVTA